MWTKSPFIWTPRAVGDGLVRNEEWAEVDFQFESHRGTEVMLMKLPDLQNLGMRRVSVSPKPALELCRLNHDMRVDGVFGRNVNDGSYRL